MVKKTKQQTKLQKYFPWLLIIGASIGLIAAFILTMEKFALLENPQKELICDINPVVSCGSVIMTPQASAFHFPNPFLGLAGFSVLITLGMSMLAGAVIIKKWYWRTYLVATFLGAAFIHWLAYQSLYNIGALCPYCMVVWAVTIPIFWYSLLWTLREGVVSLPKGWDKVGVFIQRNHFGILLGWYLLVIGLILHRFWYFFGF